MDQDLRDEYRNKVADMDDDTICEHFAALLRQRMAIIDDKDLWRESHKDGSYDDLITKCSIVENVMAFRFLSRMGYYCDGIYSFRKAKKLDE